MSATTETKPSPSIVDKIRDPKSTPSKALKIVGWLALIAGGAYLAEKRADAKYERGFRVGYELGSGGKPDDEEF